MPHYHQREEVSLLSSGRDQVVHSCYCRQQTVVALGGLTYELSLLSLFMPLSTEEFNGLDIESNFVFSILTSFHTKSSYVLNLS